ncbi:MAG: hypothetical protein ACE5FQ_06805 [Thiogranum sp.]
MGLGSLESVAPYLPFFIVIVWGLYRMFLKMGKRLYYRRKVKRVSEAVNKNPPRAGAQESLSKPAADDT